MNPSGTRNHLAEDLDHLERPVRSRMILGPRDRVPARTKKEQLAAAKCLECLTADWGCNHKVSTK